MIQVEINNSYSRITGYSQEQFKELKTLLSYDIDAKASYFSGNHFNTKRYLIDKRGEFPTGLLTAVWLYIKDEEIKLIDLRRRPKAHQGIFEPSGTLTPYPSQTAAVEAATSAGGGTIVMPTGTGKSIAMAMLVNELQVKTLIVVPTLELKRQLKETFTSIFKDLKNVTIENIDSKSLNTHTEYDCLVIDEAHHSAAATYRRLNKKAWRNIYHRFCFTATPFRSRDEEQMLMESITGEVIYRLEYQDAVKYGYIVPMEAYYIDLPKQKVESYTWSEVYKELVVCNDYRNEAIADLLRKLHNSGKSTLCLVKEIAHGEILSKLTGAAFANGQSDDCEQLISWFNQGKLKTLIGTTGVLGEGVDSRPAEYIIVAGLGKSKPAFMQMCGRGFRRYPGKESCKVILFSDKSHKWARAHFKAQRDYLLAEYGVTVVELKL